MRTKTLMVGMLLSWGGMACYRPPPPKVPATDNVPLATEDPVRKQLVAFLEGSGPQDALAQGAGDALTASLATAAEQVGRRQGPELARAIRHQGNLRCFAAGCLADVHFASSRAAQAFDAQIVRNPDLPFAKFPTGGRTGLLRDDSGLMSTWYVLVSGRTISAANQQMAPDGGDVPKGAVQ